MQPLSDKEEIVQRGEASEAEDRPEKVVFPHEDPVAIYHLVQ
jgi:hypothetical protein